MGVIHISFNSKKKKTPPKKAPHLKTRKTPQTHNGIEKKML